MKRSLTFALACAASIGAVWGMARLVFRDTTSGQALGIAAAVAFAVQMVAFVIARQFARRKNVMAGWGIGIALRFAALLAFGFFVVPALGLPMSSSLLGLAIFLFVTTLIEPLFLKT
jgi:hypothetical protein